MTDRRVSSLDQLLFVLYILTIIIRISLYKNASAFYMCILFMVFLVFFYATVTILTYAPEVTAENVRRATELKCIQPLYDAM